MRPRERTVVLWGISMLSGLSLVLAAAWAVVPDGLWIHPDERGLAGFNYPGSELVWALAFGLGGAVITRSQPRHVVGRLLLWSGLAGAVAALLGQLGLGTSIALLTSYSLLVLAIVRFPDGDWVSRSTKWLSIAMLVSFGTQALVWSVAGWALSRGMLDASGDPPAWLNLGISAASLLGFALLIGVIVGQIRIARSDPVRGRQIAVVVLGGVIGILISLPARWLEGSQTAGLLNSLSGILFPVTIVIAVTRYRLYEIDRVISRTVSYGIVIAAMVGVYLAVLFGLGSLLDLGGDTEVALATLAAVAVSVPLLTRVRRWVDRRFFRSRYDSALVVARVADDLRTTVDLDEVERRTEAVIDEVFSPEDVTVWLVDRTGS